jgi:hypothetical protein
MITADVGSGDVELARGIEGDRIAADAARCEMMWPVNRAGLRRYVRTSPVPGIALSCLEHALIDA